MLRFVFALSCVLSWLAVPRLEAQNITLPENFYDEKVASGWDRPIGITFDEQGRGYVWEKKGKVFLLDIDGNKQTEPLIDISEEIDNWSDLGLIGFALDPDFYQNGYYYLLYVVDRHYLEKFGTPEYDPDFTQDHNATIGRITRYTADSSTGFTSTLPESRHVLLGNSWEDGAAVLLGSHSVGSLVFGQDGTLLASFGDGGSYESTDTGNTPSSETYWEDAITQGTLREEDNVGALKSLQVDNYNGSIIRIDPETGAGIASNPFYDTDNPQAPRSKIWATGFRNPYRFIHVKGTGSHNPENGDPGTFFIGDVGGSGWEELNISSRGGQCFGWPMFEGINYHWGFKNKPTENPDAANPINCGRDFFTFEELIQQPNYHGENLFSNPCNSALLIPENIPTFVHTPPVLSWSGLLWNPPPRTLIPGFDEETGQLKEVNIGLSTSTVEGAAFAGFSSIPGFFYEDETFPERYHGALFHADLSGWIKATHFNEAYEVTRIDTFATWDDKCIAAIAYNEFDGSIYWCNVYTSEVRRISFGGDPKPIAKSSADVLFGPSPLDVQFDGSASFDPNGTAITHFWDFGDGSTSTLINPEHLFTSATDGPESFNVSLTVKDSLGQTDTSRLLVSLNNTPPLVKITSSEDGDLYPINGLTFLELKAEVSDEEHGNEDLNYTWETFLHHNNHYHPNNPEYNETSSLIIDPIGCDLEDYWYRIRLSVTDAAGLTAYDEIEMYPNCADPSFNVLDLAGREQADGSVLLNWTTDLEEDVQFFEIQRTEDFHFVSIDQVPAIGVGASYTYLDNEAPKGANYYRLKGVDSEGNYFYSNVIYINLTSLGDFTVFPNPTSDILNVFLLEASAPEMEFEIIAPTGAVIYSQKWPALVGFQFSERLVVTDLPAGFYVYRIKNGEQEKSGSFIKY